MPSFVAPITPHGGKLINQLRIEGPAAAALYERALVAPLVQISEVILSDLELIAIGVVSPLTGFMDRSAYQSVLEHMHLPDGLPWTIPITLPVSADVVNRLRVGQDVALADPAGRIVGLLELSDIFRYDKTAEAEAVYRTTDDKHPGVARLYAQGDHYLAGNVWMLVEPVASFPDLAYTPLQTRELFSQRGWRQIVAFQTRNPIHRAHEYLQKCALEMVDGLLLHPLVGETKGDDIPADVRVESYRAVLEHYYPASRVLLAAFPAAMRYAGPREAVFHAICRKNYGCTHFIVGRDHAGVGNYYGTYDAQLIFREFDPELIGITPLMFEHAFHCHACGQVVTAKTCPHDSTQWLHLSGTQVRQKLLAGELLPLEFTRPEVSRILMRGMDTSR
ncbi:MAG: sulfate adenylyltransferase [Anaerolineae bacterium]|nr:sulfate adenylyltransferase [Anaerolineae bacterium]